MKRIIERSFVFVLLLSLIFTASSCGKKADFPAANDGTQDTADTEKVTDGNAESGVPETEKGKTEETETKKIENDGSKTDASAETAYVWNDPAPKIPEKPEAPVVTWTPSEHIKLVTSGGIDVLEPSLRTFVCERLSAKNIDYEDGRYTSVSSKEGNAALFEWTLDGITGDAIVYFSTNADLSDPVSVKANGNTASVYNLMTGTRYFWWVEIKTDDAYERSDVGTVDIADGPRILNVKGVINARDIGGWLTEDGRRMKEGLVYRSGRLTIVKQDGIDTMLDTLHIVTELDLRKETEIIDEKSPLGVSPLGQKVNYVNISAPCYNGVFGDEKTTAEILRLFADIDNYPIIFHCAGGADRTGSFATLLEAVCGCDESTLVTDFELTEGRGCDYNTFDELVKAVLESPGTTIREKADFTCRFFGLTKMEVSNIYNILMTSSGIFKHSSLRSGTKVDGGKQFKIDLRESGGIHSVRVNNAEVEWKMDGDTLTVFGTKGKGIIVFRDGDVLEFAM